MTCSAKRNREARAAPPEGQAGRGGDHAEKLGDGEPRGGAGARSLFKRPRGEEGDAERERERERERESLAIRGHVFIS
jgi:hypothetical protein